MHSFLNVSVSNFASNDGTTAAEFLGHLDRYATVGSFTEASRLSSEFEQVTLASAPLQESLAAFYVREKMGDALDNSRAVSDTWELRFPDKWSMGHVLVLFCVLTVGPERQPNAGQRSTRSWVVSCDLHLRPRQGRLDVHSDSRFNALRTLAPHTLTPHSSLFHLHYLSKPS